MAQWAALALADRDPAKRGGACRILFCRFAAECDHYPFLQRRAPRHPQGFWRAPVRQTSPSVAISLEPARCLVSPGSNPSDFFLVPSKKLQSASAFAEAAPQ